LGGSSFSDGVYHLADCRCLLEHVNFSSGGEGDLRVTNNHLGWHRPALSDVSNKANEIFDL
jgi:hypothetical protein